MWVSQRRIFCTASLKYFQSGEQTFVIQVSLCTKQRKIVKGSTTSEARVACNSFNWQNKVTGHANLKKYKYKQQSQHMHVLKLDDDLFFVITHFSRECAIMATEAIQIISKDCLGVKKIEMQKKIVNSQRGAAMF
jgi:hypothetical protein